MKGEAIRVRFDTDDDRLITKISTQTGLRKIDVIRLLVKDGLKAASGYCPKEVVQ